MVKKSYKSLVMAVIFPYLLTLMVLLCCILPMTFDGFNGVQFDIVVFFMFTVACFIVAIVLVIIKGVRVLKDDNYTAYDLLKTNRNIKLIHILAYVCNFIMGLILLFTVMLMGLSVIIIAYDVLSITLTGVWGMFGILKLKKEQKISIKRTMFYIVLQFIFCIDVISAILLPAICKKSEA